MPHPRWPLLAGLAAASLAAAQPEADPGRVTEVALGPALAGERVQLVLVKDFLPVRNTGATRPAVEFERYLAPCDEEQIVVARWVDAATDGGTRPEASVVSVREDAWGNQLQRYRVAPLPGKQFVTVTVTTLVARRERPPPIGAFPIPAAEAYPERVRPFLSSTAMTACDDPVVVKTADAILSRTRDAYEVAAAIADLARQRPYLPSGAAGSATTLAGSVLERGGSCCASAVAAAAVLRRCGIPAQVTYCPPPSYVHGIVRFWLAGYGWVRMDATSGTGQLPLAHDEASLAFVRVYDMPIEMEKLEWAYAWPWHNNDDDGEYTFWIGGRPAAGVRFEARDQAEAARRGGVAGFVEHPFPHLEPGSWSALLGSEPIGPGTPWADWDALAAEARRSVADRVVGPVAPVIDRIPALGPYVDRARLWCRPGNDGPEPK